MEQRLQELEALVSRQEFTIRRLVAATPRQVYD